VASVWSGQVGTSQLTCPECTAVKRNTMTCIRQKFSLLRLSPYKVVMDSVLLNENEHFSYVICVIKISRKESEKYRLGELLFCI